MGTILGRLWGNKPKTSPPQIQHQKILRKNFDLKTPIKNGRFVAFDTELTGLDFKRDSIISIGAVKLNGNKILPAKAFYRLVKPESELKGQSVVVHELTHTELDKADDLSDVMVDFLDFIEDAVLIGHFIHIDLNFTNRFLKKKYACPLKNYAVDTSTLHDWLYENDSTFTRRHKGLTSKTDLFSLAKRYGVTVDNAHNAFSDAYMTAQLFQRFVHFLPQYGIKTVKELLAISRP